MTDKSERVVVTGITGGIAAATAGLLVKHGYDVVVSARDEARLDQAVAELGPKAKGFVMDLTDPASVTEFFEAVGTFDHLVTPVTQLENKVLVVGAPVRRQRGQVSRPFGHAHRAG